MHSPECNRNDKCIGIELVGKEGAILIDVGTSNVNGKITGVFVIKNIRKSCFCTPVPGGVDAITTTLLLRNTLQAFKYDVY